MSVPQYKFIQCVKICHKQSRVLADDEILCKIPLNSLALKLTIKYAKEFSMLHDMCMPSKFQLKNTQTLLKRHKCLCGDFVSIFKPHVVVPNSHHQKTWYQNHVLSIICNLNIKHLIGNQHTSLTGPKICWISTRSTINRFISEDCVWFLCWHFSRCVWRNWLCSLWEVNSNLWNGRLFWSWEYQFS